MADRRRIGVDAYLQENFRLSRRSALAPDDVEITSPHVACDLAFHCERKLAERFFESVRHFW
jgi:hypothetical protein